MAALTKFLSDCNAGGYAGGIPSLDQMLQLQKEEEFWCNPEQIESQKQRLIHLKEEGKYPLLDPHPGYGDIEIDARFICDCNSLHINGDNGIQMGIYVLVPETGKYIGREDYKKLATNPELGGGSLLKKLIGKFRRIQKMKILVEYGFKGCFDGCPFEYNKYCGQFPAPLAIELKKREKHPNWCPIKQKSDKLVWEAP